MSNLIDITEMTDAALDVLLRVKGGEDTVCADSLTVTERRMVAQAMGWDLTNRLTQHWISEKPQVAFESKAEAQTTAAELNIRDTANTGESAVLCPFKLLFGI